MRAATKSEAQQAILALHRMRDQLVKFRTGQIICVRGLVSEYGEVTPASRAECRRDRLCHAAVSYAATSLLIDTLNEQIRRMQIERWAKHVRLAPTGFPCLVGIGAA